MCLHEWKRIGESKHLKYDYSGVEVVVAECKCTKCEKKKYRKFIGHVVGQLFRG